MGRAATGDDLSVDDSREARARGLDLEQSWRLADLFQRRHRVRLEGGQLDCVAVHRLKRDQPDAIGKGDVIQRC